MNENKVEIEEINEGFTLIELLNSIKHHIVLLLLFCIGFVGLGVFYTLYVVTPMYTSTVDIRIHIKHEQTSGTDSTKTATTTQVANNIKEYIKFTEIIDYVIEEYDLDDQTKSIANRITTSSLGNSAAVRVSYEDDDLAESRLIVEKVAEELARRINLEPTEEGSLKFATETVQLINRPKNDPLQAPSSPNKVLNILISLILGGIVGVVIVILKDQFSNRYNSKKEVETLLNLPVIAIIPSQEGLGDNNE